MRLLISCLLLLLLLTAAGCDYSVSQSEKKLIAERLDQYSLQKYGPPNGEAYGDYFGGYSSGPDVPAPAASRPGTQATSQYEEGLFKSEESPAKWKDAESNLVFSSVETSFTLDQQARLRDYFEKNDAVLRKIDNVLKGGRAYWSLTSAIKTGKSFSADWLSFQILAKTLRLRGNWALSQGRPDEAVEWYDRTARFSVSLGVGRTLIQDLMAVASQSIAMGGYQSLVWSDAPPQAIRKALDRLNTLEDEITKDSLDDALAFDSLQAIASAPEKNTVRFFSARTIRRWLTIVLYLPVYDQETVNSKLTQIRHRKYFTRFNETKAKTENPLRFLRITNTPALRKRIKECAAQEPAFFRNKLFSPQELRNLSPALLFVMSPYRRGDLDAGTRSAMARQWYQETRLAFAARLYRAEKGRDPNSLSDLVPDYLPRLPKSEFPEKNKASGSIPTIRPDGATLPAATALPAAAPTPAPAQTPQLPAVPLEPSGFALCRIEDTSFWVSALIARTGLGMMNYRSEAGVTVFPEANGLSVRIEKREPPRPGIGPGMYPGMGPGMGPGMYPGMRSGPYPRAFPDVSGGRGSTTTMPMNLNSGTGSQASAADAPAQKTEDLTERFRAVLLGNTSLVRGIETTRLEGKVEGDELSGDGFGVVLKVYLKEDLHPLAVVSAGPSGEPVTNPPMVYDPTNGTRSGGAIVTPAGF